MADETSPGGLPRRDDIVAYEIPHLLPNLLIAEPTDGGADWIYRLVGTAIVARSGRDTTGMRVRQIFPPEVADVYSGDYRSGVENRAPWFARGYFTLPGTEHVQFVSVRSAYGLLRTARILAEMHPRTGGCRS